MSVLNVLTYSGQYFTEGKTMNVVLIVGTRPQIIKSSPFIHLASRDNEMRLAIVHTGQHYDYELTKVFFEELSLPDPAVNLHVGSGSHAVQTAKMMVGTEKALLELEPDLVIVPGDTNSALAGALVASKLNIPLAHMEAGARSYDMKMPEEINRCLTDHCSTILFAPTGNCRDNLLKENVERKRVFLTGDTMYDALLYCLPKVEKSNGLNEYDLIKKKYILLTLHRPENVDNPKKLDSILKACEKMKNLQIVFPVHPRTKAKLKGKLYKRLMKRDYLKIIKPVGYMCSLNLIKNAEAILTDSGGMQKEAFWLHTPCITLRESTEWIETVELKANRLTGSNPEKILQGLQQIRDTERVKENLEELPNPFGDGKASNKILQIVKTSCLELNQ
jgi:UDP-N-acetylglucosamine 2-epimerase